MRRLNSRHVGTLRRVVRITVRSACIHNDGSRISGILITRRKSVTRVHECLGAFLNRESWFQFRSTREYSHAPPSCSRETKEIDLRTRVSVRSNCQSDERDYHAVVLSRSHVLLRLLRDRGNFRTWRGID